MAGPERIGSIERFREWARTIAHVRRDMRVTHRRMPALLRPRRFSDKMQWRKLFDDNPLLGVFSDKLAVRGYIAERVGAVHVVPVLWSGDRAEDIPFDRLVPPYVLKSTHASGHVAVVQAGERVDEAALREKARGWLGHSHALAMAEAGYLDVPHQLVVEPLVTGPGGGSLVEYRLLGFDGRIGLIQASVALGAERVWTTCYYDGTFRPIPFALVTTNRREMPPPSPDRVAAMIGLAERLTAGMDHLRVDIYDAAEGLMVNELTAYAWSGIEPFRSAEDDLWLGSFWTIRHPASRAIRRVLFGRWGVGARAWNR